jgi:hypothetical protein
VRTIQSLRLSREIYIILAGILLAGFSFRIAASGALSPVRHNEALVRQISVWKATELRVPAPEGPPFCAAYQSGDESSMAIQRQLERVLAYMKKPVRTYDVLRESFDPAGCEAVIANVRNLQRLGDPARLAAYVEDGGHVLLTQPPEINDAFYRLYRKLGIVNTGGYGIKPGVELVGNVLIGEKGLRIGGDTFTNWSLEVELDPESRLLVRSTDGTPLLWDRAYGRGKFMTFNGTMLVSKTSRGLLAGAISMLLPDFLYPIFNSKTVILDDFPAPIRPGIDPDLYRLYRRDIPTFFKEIWWPDMLRAARQHDLVYTAALIESYNDRVEPPFAHPPDEDVRGLMAFGREVLRGGGEIGLHGYNHQSLEDRRSVYGYNVWSGIGPMREAVEEALRHLQRAFPEYRPLTYVPPSNVLSPTGREALKQAWPDLAVIASLCVEDAQGIAYVQEFEVAPDGILEMPRVTTGYGEAAYFRWAEANVITLHGVFSHFLHPDDVLDPARNFGQSWDRLYERFTEDMARIRRTYPWLKAQSVAEAAADMGETLTGRFALEREGNVLRAEWEPEPAGTIDFILRTGRALRRVEGATAVRIDEGVYLVQTESARFTIELGE